MGLSKQQIEKIRTQLLDLTKRNSLISFKHSARSKRFIRFIDEIPDEIIKKLADQVPLSVEPIPFPPNEPEDELTPHFIQALDEAKSIDSEFVGEIISLGESPSEKAVESATNRLRDRIRDKLGLPPIDRLKLPDIVSFAEVLGINPDFDLPRNDGKIEPNEKHTDNKLQTLYYPDELDRRLRSIFEDARLSESEKGISTVYIALGFLEWYEADASEAKLNSPLLLFPVQLSRKLNDGKYSFTIVLSETQPSYNRALIELMKRDFGISIPIPEEDDTFDSYADKIGKLVEDKKHWKIKRFATLGFFGFSKEIMYEDLGRADWTDSHTELADVVLNGRDGLEDGSTPVDFEELHEFTSESPMLVLDADSTQISAIVTALDGRNLVIEGPPGTGKSQTIANLIANLLHQEKKVLFLAEKTAALEAVKRYLDKSDLGQFCLELHSNKTDKGELHKKIQASKEGRKSKPSISSVAFLEERQSEIKSEIRDYVDALLSTPGKLGETARNLMWSFINDRENYPNESEAILQIELMNFRDYDQSKLDSIQRLLRQLEVSRSDICPDGELISEHVWYGLANCETSALNENLYFLKLSDISKVIDKYLEASSKVALYFTRLSPDLRSLVITICESLRQLQSFESDTVRLGIKVDRIENGPKLLIEYLKAKESYDEKILEVHSIHPGFGKKKDLEISLLSEISSILRQKITNLETINSVVSEISRLQIQIELMQRFAAFYTELSKETNLELNLESFPEFFQCLLYQVRIKEALSEAPDLDQVDLESTSKILNYKDHQKKLSELRFQLKSSFFIDADCEIHILRQAFSEIRNRSIWSIFRKEYRSAKKLIKSVYYNFERSSPEKLSQEMREFFEYLEVKKAVESSMGLKEALKVLFKGADTDFDKILNFIETKKVLRKLVVKLDRGCNEVELFVTNLSLSRLSQLLKYSDLCRNMGEIPLGVQKSSDLAMNIARCLADTKLFSELRQLLTGLEVSGEFKLSNIDPLLERLVEGRVLETKLEKASIAVKDLNLLELPEPSILESFQSICSTLSDLKARNFENSKIEAMVNSGHQLLIDGWLRDLGCLVDCFDELSEALEALEKKVDVLSFKSRFSDSSLSDEFLKRLKSAVDVALSNNDRHQSFCSFLRVRNEVRLSDAEVIVAEWEKRGFGFSSIDRFFKLLLIKDLLGECFGKHTKINKSFGHKLELLRDEFKRNDKKLIGEYASKVKFKLYSVPLVKGISSGGPKLLTEDSLLEHEAAKKTRHIPIRELLKRAPLSIRTLKPCFMMSPMCIAQFLGPEFPKFDVIIMDEASQLKVQDVVGGLIRATQSIIVGDPHQLPPTSFFDSSSESNDSDIEDEESFRMQDQESILNLALGTISSVKRLKWHYRSRHQSLIAYSNREFYDNELVLFPSPFERHPAFGFEYREVSGIYEKRRNDIEADEVVNAIVKFMADYPDRSLGVVAINQEQKENIREKFEAVARVHPNVIDYLERWENDLRREPFFIKNLENVQGDERDVIFVSTVYGVDSIGNFYNRFGPINGPMGHRRLNVLFTRAKCKIILFSSIPLNRLVVQETSSRGLRVFKGFLEFAKTGKLPPDRYVSHGGTDSLFEDLVLSALQSKGYSIATQVGVAGYFIDLAVRSKKVEGRFLLGIECDGKAFHSSKSARDRDRLRQENLERLGWKIYRIWSTDWFHNPKHEVSKLLKEISNLEIGESTVGF